MEKLIDVFAAAELLGISRWTLERWKAIGRIIYIKLGRRCLFDPNDLAEWVESQKVKAK